MKLRAIVLAGVLGSALAGCAGMDAKDVKVVELGAVPQGSYDLVARVWTETWMTPFWIPWYATEADAMEGLKSQAALRGADAVANAVCIPAPTAWGGTRYFCHGDAVKMRPAADRPFFTPPKT
ncbi:MAG: hypothetical protein N2544_04980 [Burkholderiales bacterium]|nr:hypothetical protein [Burkholderiales bacterium]